MHVLAIEQGAIDTGDQAVDLGQSPGDVVVLCAADTELGLISQAHAAMCAQAAGEEPTIRLASLLTLRHNYSVDLYVERTLAHARLIVVRLLGGRSYWPYGVERLTELARTRGIALAILPGEDRWDQTLDGLSTLDPERVHHLWRCLSEGGPDNARLFLRAAHAIVSAGAMPEAPRPVPRAGLYRSFAPLRDGAANGRAAIVFYRALVQAGDLDPVDALCAELVARRLAVDAYFVASLRDEASRALLEEAFADGPPDVVLNATAFASGGVADMADGRAEEFGTDAPWLQVIFSGGSEDAWRDGTSGLGMRDIAMHVSLPEMDGRVLARAVAFKRSGARDPRTQHAVTRLEPVRDRVAYVADLAAAWVRLRRTPPPERSVAIVLANYPNRDSRLANGVGLATPESAVALLRALEAAGYDVADAPSDADALMDRLLAGPTNAAGSADKATEHLPLAAYERWLKTLPGPARASLLERWGPPRDDPFVVGDRFALPVHCLGNVAVAIQPARGYNIDPKATYHDPALVPPHGYLAFHLWLRTVFAVDAIVHLGKHGNLEWLPGKSLALSASCWPEIALGPIPNVYPFIVNDPGEGAQAKRRAAAVIVDHMTPPLTRAETYGDLAAIEALVDEYYEAQAVDPRRAARLSADIVTEASRIGLDVDCAIPEDASDAERLRRLDAYLCDLKEMQIRGGLHVLGRSPQGNARIETLAALVRLPRGSGAADASLHRAIAADLDLRDFDPLDCDLAEPWRKPRPAPLGLVCRSPWRTSGDTVERVELLAERVIGGQAAPPGAHSRAVLAEITGRLAPALDACGPRETAALLAALDGRRIPPGPSGAPTRGRPDVLPTGRNFYSLDSRSLPTPTAWEIGRKAAEALVARYVQDHGDYPVAIAMSAWGTANMRTGGDDLAQMLALLGARPVWETGSRRVTGFEVLPIAALGRPRVDVTLRISGFFRDAFPQQIAMLDSVVRAIAERDEPDEDNPIRARVEADADRLRGEGVAPSEARRRAALRVFGSKPGAYGAGLQAMFDERLWRDEADLAEAFLGWSQYAYGAGSEGAAEPDLMRQRLTQSDAVLHNQDNREHDILDSDDYYQFAGGLAVAARVLKGRAVPVYHGDHSRPERPVVRALGEEIARVVRARAVNPKWIAAMMRHGYKGAFEMAATVDYLFAFAATARAVRDHHFDAVYDAYIGDDEVRAFLEGKNPAALADIAARLGEAIDRELWRPRSNSAQMWLRRLSAAEQEVTP